MHSKSSVKEGKELALSEGSIYMSGCRRSPAVRFDSFLYHATLIYEPAFALGSSACTVNISISASATVCPCLR